MITPTNVQRMFATKSVLRYEFKIERSKKLGLHITATRDSITNPVMNFDHLTRKLAQAALYELNSAQDFRIASNS